MSESQCSNDVGIMDGWMGEWIDEIGMTQMDMDNAWKERLHNDLFSLFSQILISVSTDNSNRVSIMSSFILYLFAAAELLDLCNICSREVRCNFFCHDLNIISY